MKLKTPLNNQEKTVLLAASALFVIAIILMQWFHLKPLLQFDRLLINQGEIWRIFTGNFIHYNFKHMWMNLAGLAVGMYLLAFRYSLFYWFIIICFSSLMVGAGLYIFDTQLMHYVGLSGALHGMLVVGALVETTYNKSTGLLLLVFISSKLLYEQFFGALSPPLSAHTSVAVNAHLYGSIAGVIIWLALTYLPNNKSL